MAKRLRDDSVSDTDVAAAGVERSSRSQSVESSAHTPKYTTLEAATGESKSATMRCSLPPHKPMSFATYDEYQSHYQKDHANRCLECGKNFPTAHFLDLHIAENHDPIVASKRDAEQKTFRCFVEDCEKVCIDWRKRRSHLVDKHGYPKNYDFLVVDHGIDGRKSMLRPGIDSEGHRRSSRERNRSGSSATETTQSTEATSVSEVDGTARKAGASDSQNHMSNGVKPQKDGRIDELTDSMSALKMVPRSITFGKRKGRSGFAKQ